MKSIVAFVLCAFCCFGYEVSYLISDEDFTNQNFNSKDVINFVRVNFPKCPLTDLELKCTTHYAFVEKINVVVLLAKQQQEQSLIEDNVGTDILSRKNQAMGCRLYSFYTGKQRLQFWGYYNQIKYGAHILHDNFVDFEYGNEINLEDTKIKKVWPQNAATWSLYVYCPSFGRVDSHPWMTKGKSFIGNRVFGEVFERYKKAWIKMYGSF